MTSNHYQTTIKLIATDIDRTLLNDQHALTERTISALKAAATQGVALVMATGKTSASAVSIREALGVPFYGIFLQGLQVVDPNGKLLREQTLSADVARSVITFAEDRGFTVLAYSGSRLLTRARSQIAEDYTVPFHEPMPEVVGPLQNLLWTTPVHKLAVFGEPRTILGLRWQLNAQLGSSARVVQAGVPLMLEVLPPGMNKGVALKSLLKELHLAPENVLAVGDAENDIEMIQLAGIGVAVGNADQKVKDSADHVVASNDEDGVAEAIERFVLRKTEPAVSTDSAEVSS